MLKISAAEYLTRADRRSMDGIACLEPKVRPILDDVRRRGDAAIADYTAKFDGPDAVPARLEASADERQEAWGKVDQGVVQALETAAQRIREFHVRQTTQSWITVSPDGSSMGQMVRPIETAGIYVPGGTAAYPSSVLMTAIPARVAGVKQVIVCTPPGPDGKANPYVLVAADIAGVDRVFKVGGCQAIAAMAFGTDTIPAVDKIVGPGNAYVTAAKRLVYGYCDIDMLAGPSELAVLADGACAADLRSQARLIAADMLSQAEHGPDSQAVLVTTSVELAAEVERELAAQAAELPRHHTIMAALEGYGMIILADDMDQAIAAVNCYAPEHLEVLTAEPATLLGRLVNAGSVMLGPSSPVAANDYATGPNHVLPTGGTARSWSALGVRDFVRMQSVTSLTAEGLRAIAGLAETIAEAEGLTAHAASVRVRGCEK
jgi:histidinol dehydrogenase